MTTVRAAQTGLAPSTSSITSAACSMLVNGGDIRVIQRRDRSRFPLEAAPGDLLAADYVRYDAVYTRVSGTLNGLHAQPTSEHTRRIL